MLKNLSRSLFFCLAFFALLTNSVSAQGASGIGLKPALIEEGLDPGSSKTYTITVTNLSNKEQTFYFSRRDIVSVNDGGAPVFARDNVEPTGFELSQWITLSQTEMQMAPKEEKTLTFDLNVPEDASPGSHFGAVVISVEPPKLRSSGAAVGYEVTNIISIRVAGDALVKANLRSFRTDNYIYSRPLVEFSATIRNEGNVLVRPTGPLEVFNMFGKKVASLTFNESKAGVFPGSDRDFEIIWEDERTGFGRYEATLSPVYGEDGSYQTIYSSVSFWILPMNIIGPALAVLAVLLLTTYFGVRMYIKRTLNSYGHTTRRVGGVNRSRRGNSPFLLVLVVMLVVTSLFLIILLALFS